LHIIHLRPLYEKGDLVWLCTQVYGRQEKVKKLYLPWAGPFKDLTAHTDQ